MRAFPRTVASACFVCAIAGFALPFVTAEEQRVGKATGFELVAQRPIYTGEYRQALFEGSVERLVDNGTIPAAVVLALFALGLVLAWLPGRVGAFAVLGCALLALVWLLFLYLALTTELVPSELEAGYWLAVVLAVGATAWAAWCLRRRSFT